MILSDVILPDVTMLLRVMLGLGVSVVSDAERYPGGNGITSGSIRTESPDVTVTKRHKQSPSFLSSCCFEVSVVAMGVLDRAKAMSGLAASEEDGLPYVCLACETALEVRHYTCPVCGSFDVRCSKWVRE